MEDVAPAFLRPKDVCDLLNFSRTTLWRLRKSGEFPVARKIGGDVPRLIGWPRTEIEAWVESLSQADQIESRSAND